MGGRTGECAQRAERATALLGHADEGTTVRHYVKRTHVAPDLRAVIDQLIQQAEGKTE
ncbi:hypothetical protein NKG05_16875 [Oerskovia sp. M15]